MEKNELNMPEFRLILLNHATNLLCSQEFAWGIPISFISYVQSLENVHYVCSLALVYLLSLWLSRSCQYIKKAIS